MYKYQIELATLKGGVGENKIKQNNKKLKNIAKNIEYKKTIRKHNNEI